ncbi:MAG: hypothetical protein RLZZ624_890 [Cyanobacteriota bacterium]
MTAGLKGAQTEAQVGHQGAEGHQLRRAIAALKSIALAAELLEDGLTERLVLGEQLLQTQRGAARLIVGAGLQRTAIGFAGGQAQQRLQLTMAERLRGGRDVGREIGWVVPVHRRDR